MIRFNVCLTRIGGCRASMAGATIPGMAIAARDSGSSAGAVSLLNSLDEVGTDAVVDIW
jgi:hypothetical protein